MAYSPLRKSSTDTDRRYLLSDSIAPSESASMIDYAPSIATADAGADKDGERTPRANRSPMSSQINLSGSSNNTITTQRRATLAQPYRGFPSEDAYIAALQHWAEGKKYVEHGTALIGFYGHKTMQDIAEQPAPEILGPRGLKKKWDARRARKREGKMGGEARLRGGESRSEVGLGDGARERRNTVA